MKVVSSFVVCVCYFPTDDDSAVPKKSSERPSWALFGKVNQNMETILFREKFADWPDSSRLIKVKDTQPTKQKVNLKAGDREIN